MFEINITAINKIASYVGRPIVRAESDGQTSIFSLHVWHSPAKLKPCIAVYLERKHFLLTISFGNI